MQIETHKEKALNMNLGNITSKLTKHADTLATLYGYYTICKQAGWDLNQMFTKPFTNISEGKIPSLEKIIWRLTEAPYCSPTFKNGIMLWILSEVAGGLIPAKYASAGKKIGQGLIKGSLVASVAIGGSPAQDALMHSSGGHSSGGNSPSRRYPA